MKLTTSFVFLFCLLLTSSAQSMNNAKGNNSNVLLASIIENLVDYNAFLATIYPLYVGYNRIQTANMPPDTEHSALLDEWDHCNLNESQKNFKPIMEKILEKTGVDKTKIRFQVGGNYALGSEAFATHHHIALTDYFFELTDEQKEFLATHETIHYKKEHVKKVGIASICISLATTIGLCACSYACDVFINVFAPENKDLIVSKKLADAFIFKNCGTQAFIMQYGIHAYSCYIEKQADIEAAKALDTAHGGIKLMGYWMEQQNTYIQKLSSKPTNSSNEHKEKSVPIYEIADKQIKQLSLAKYIKNELDRLYGFTAHPTLQERLKYLKDWQEKRDKETVLNP